MARFKCKNKDCSKYDKEISEAKVKWIWSDKVGGLAHNIKCIECRHLLSHIKEESTGVSNVFFAKFNSLSPKEKKEVLKKRADQHNKTKMKDRVYEIKKKFTGNAT